jgi:D-3-phosphoglycerate dehydrogenase
MLGAAPRRYRVLETDRPDRRRVEGDEVLADSGLFIDHRHFQWQDEDHVIESCAEADALLVAYAPLTRRVLGSLDRCRLVSYMTTGFDSIDLEAATDLGIVVTNVPDYCTHEVADHTIALLLALDRKIVSLHADCSQGSWRFDAAGSPQRLRGRRLGIVGLGRIGTQVALRASAFGLEVVARDPFVDRGAAEAHGVRLCETFAEVMACDIVSLHCPLTDETAGLIDAGSLSLMSPSALLINTARGACVDTSALVRALESHALAGAGLDVVDPEPLPPDHPLRGHPNAILTPHAAFHSSTAVAEARRRACSNVVRALSGRVPIHVVNPAVLASPNLRFRPSPGRV